MITIEGLHLITLAFPWLVMALGGYLIYLGLKKRVAAKYGFVIFLGGLILLVASPIKLKPQSDYEKRLIKDHISTDVYRTDDDFKEAHVPKFDPKTGESK